MENKFEERAKELILDSCVMTMKMVGISKEDFVDNIVIEMCQLAEEVEKKCLSYLYGKGMYTKEQVEELLLKQRELCAEYMYSIDESLYRGATKNQVLRSPLVNLNAKLKID